MQQRMKPLVWQRPTSRRDITGTEVLPRQQGDQAPHWALPALRPAPGQALITSGFENQQGLTQERWTAIGNCDSTLSITQSKTPCLKSTQVIHKGDSLTNFRHACQRGGDLWELSLGMEVLVGTIFLALLQPSWPEACGSQFLYFPLPYWHHLPCSTNPPTPASTPAKGLLPCNTRQTASVRSSTSPGGDTCQAEGSQPCPPACLQRSQPSTGPHRCLLQKVTTFKTKCS